MPKLFLVPTPIGNLSDITLRALDVLKEVDFLLAEDTRHSSILLKHYEIDKKASPFHQNNEHKVLSSTVNRILNVETAAFISDAGTPGISDPGFLLIRACLEKQIEIECLPGATALIPAIVNSGFPSDRFIFEGFLPPKKGRQSRILKLKDEQRTVVFYESPHRLIKTLKQFLELLGPERKISISRELTKMHEETIRTTVDGALKHFEVNKPRGEFVLILAPEKKK